MTTTMSLFAVALVLLSSCVDHGESLYRTLLPLNYTAEDAPIFNGTRVTRTTSTLEECVGDDTYHMFDITTVHNTDGSTTYNCDSLALNETGQPLQVDSNTVVYDSNPYLVWPQDSFLPSNIAGRDGLGEAFSFNGVDQYLNLGDLRSTCMGNPEMCSNGITYSFWMKITNEQNRPATNKYQFISGGAQSPNSYGFACYSRDGDIRWAVRAHSKVWWIGKEININFGTWQHFIATWHKDNGLAVFLNGEQVTKVGVGWTYTPPTDVTINDFVLGRSSSFPESTEYYAEFTLQDFKVLYRTFFNQTYARDLYESSDKYDAEFLLSKGYIVPSVVAGRDGLGEAISFNGVTQYLNLGNLRSTCMGNPERCTDGVTYSLWMKITNELNRPLSTLINYISGGVDIYSIGGAVHCIVRAHNKAWHVTGMISTDYGIWQHIIMTWHKDIGLGVYLNGTLKIISSDTTNYTPPTDITANDFVIGRDNDFPQYSEHYAEFTIQDFKVLYRTFFNESYARDLYQSSDRYDAEFDLANPNQYIPRRAVGFTADFDLSEDYIPPSLVAGAGGLGEAISFNGVDQYLNLGDLRRTCMGNPELCTDGITYSFWMKITNEQNRRSADGSHFISGGGLSPDAFGFSCYANDGKFRFILRAYNKIWWIGNGINVNIGTWQHLIATWHKDIGLATYLNGNPVAKVGPWGNYTRPDDVTINDFLLGRDSDYRDSIDFYGEFTLQDFKVFYITFFNKNYARDLYVSSDRYDADFNLTNPNQYLPRRTVGFTDRQAFIFSGLTSSIHLGNKRQSCLGNLNLCPNGVTFSLWVKLTDPGYYGRIRFILSGGGHDRFSHGVGLFMITDHFLWSFRLPDGRVWANRDSGSLPDTLPVVYGHWTHLIATWKVDQGLFMYYNGVLHVRAASSEDSIAGTKYNDFAVGHANSDYGDHLGRTRGEFALEDFRVFYQFFGVSDARQMFLRRMSELNSNPLGRK